MAKIEEKVTYNGKICNLEKKVGNLSFYSYYERENDDNSQLIIVDNNKNVLARISPILEDGAYGLYFNGYEIKGE